MSTYNAVTANNPDQNYVPHAMLAPRTYAVPCGEPNQALPDRGGTAPE
jgi:hypothetical protein